VRENLISIVQDTLQKPLDPTYTAVLFTLTFTE